MTNQLHSHHWSAIVRPNAAFKDWTQQCFITFLEDCVRQAHLTPISHTGFTFQPQGVSAVVLLEESHVALHYWPEKDKISVDIHVCDYKVKNKEKAECLAGLIGESLSSNPVEWHYLSLVE